MRVYNDTTDGKYRKGIKMFDKNDENFFRFYQALDSKICDLQARGIGTESTQADLIFIYIKRKKLAFVLT